MSSACDSEVWGDDDGLAVWGRVDMMAAPLFRLFRLISSQPHTAPRTPLTTTWPEVGGFHINSCTCTCIGLCRDVPLPHITCVHVHGTCTVSSLVLFYIQHTTLGGCEGSGTNDKLKREGMMSSSSSCFRDHTAPGQPYLRC